jgi:hypothetical protein
MTNAECGIDLRASDFFDIPNLARTLRVPPADLQSAFCVRSNREVVLDSAGPCLRFCQSCLDWIKRVMRCFASSKKAMTIVGSHQLRGLIQLFRCCIPLALDCLTSELVDFAQTVAQRDSGGHGVSTLNVLNCVASGDIAYRT